MACLLVTRLICFFSMMSLVIHLVMQSDFGADKSLSFLLDNATPSSGKYMCYSIWSKNCALKISHG